MKNRLTLILALSVFTATPAFAAIIINFSGGVSEPLTVTFPEITFQNVPEGLTEYGIAILNVNPSGSQGGPRHTGTAGWNGMGTNSGGGTFGQGVDNGDIQSDDLFLWWDDSATGGNPPVSTSTMVLNAGSRTQENASYGTSVPSLFGSYEVRMFNFGGNFIGSPGTAIPEPSTMSGLVGLLALVVVWRRRGRG